jgi:hypothetical protein
MQPRNGWARIVTGAELQSVSTTGGLNPSRALCVDLTAGIDYDEGPPGSPDACFEVFWDVLDHGTGARRLTPDPNFLCVWESVGDLLDTSPILRKVRPAYQREFFCGRRLMVELSPPLSGTPCATDARYLVGARRVLNPTGRPYPLYPGAVIHSATLNDASLFILAQRFSLERVDAAIVAAAADSTEKDSFLQVFDQTAAPANNDVPIWSRRMTEINDANGDDARLGVDVWNKGWIALSSTPDVLTNFPGGYTNNLFVRPWVNVDVIRGNS